MSTPRKAWRRRNRRRLRAPFTPGEQLEQDAVRSTVGGHLHVLHVSAGQLALGVLQEAAQFLQVALPDLAGLRVDLPVVLQAEEAGGIVEGEVELLAVEHVEEQHVVPAAT